MLFKLNNLLKQKQRALWWGFVLRPCRKNKGGMMALISRFAHPKFNNGPAF